MNDRSIDFIISLTGDRQKWSAFLVLVLVLGLGWIAISAVPSAGAVANQAPSPREGFSAPDFTAALLDGGEITLSDLQGKAVIINLWAAWCPPCRAEMPALKMAYEANKDRGLEVLAIDMTYQDSVQDAGAFVQQFGLSFPIPLDMTGAIARQYQLRALPSTFFIDRLGVIRKVVVGGPMSETTIRTAIEEILEDGS